MKTRNALFTATVLAGTALLLSPANAGATEPAKPVKVFILAGQSNMQGFGFISAGKDGDMEYAAKNRFTTLKTLLENGPNAKTSTTITRVRTM